jgi:hypothetical protein
MHVLNHPDIGPTVANEEKETSKTDKVRVIRFIRIALYNKDTHLKFQTYCRKERIDKFARFMIPPGTFLYDYVGTFGNIIFLPSDALKPFIRSLTISRREKAGEVSVLPDTGIVLYFQYAGKVSYMDNGKPKSLNSI